MRTFVCVLTCAATILWTIPFGNAVYAAFSRDVRDALPFSNWETRLIVGYAWVGVAVGLIALLVALMAYTQNRRRLLGAAISQLALGSLSLVNAALLSPGYLWLAGLCGSSAGLSLLAARKPGKSPNIELTETAVLYNGRELVTIRQIAKVRAARVLRVDLIGTGLFLWPVLAGLTGSIFQSLYPRLPGFAPWDYTTAATLIGFTGAGLFLIGAGVVGGPGVRVILKAGRTVRIPTRTVRDRDVLLAHLARAANAV